MEERMNIDDLKQAANNALETETEVAQCLPGSLAEHRADEKRIMARSLFNRIVSPRIIIDILTKLEEATAALKPFADEAFQYDENDDDRVREDIEIASRSDFTLGELRHARRAIGLYIYDLPY